MRTTLYSFLFAGTLTLAVASAHGQTPQTVIVAEKAASPAPAVVPATPENSEASPAAILKLLLEMKTANEATLKKQEAALQSLDQLQEAADQIKVYSKRG